MKPYKDEDNIRVFTTKVKKLQLIWHKDKESRYIEVLEGIGWSFQRDDELPLVLSKGDIIFIKAFQTHRILKGITNLKIRINKI